MKHAAERIRTFNIVSTTWITQLLASCGYSRYQLRFQSTALLTPLFARSPWLLYCSDVVKVADEHQASPKLMIDTLLTCGPVHVLCPAYRHGLTGRDIRHSMQSATTVRPSGVVLSWRYSTFRSYAGCVFTYHQSQSRFPPAAYLRARASTYAPG